MSDELSAPLGRKKRKRPSPLQRLSWGTMPWARMGAAVLAIFALGVGGWMVLVEDPLGGRPVAEAPVSSRIQDNPLARDLQPAPEPRATGFTDITRAGVEGGPSIITFDEIDSLEARVNEIEANGTIAELTEMTSDGPLPRISSSGLAPYEAYARPAVTPHTADERKLVAVVVTGLGLNETATREAIAALPGAVTLAFAPYGENLHTLTAEARAAGHELMLEIPLEPFDYPQNDPGPHTLLVDQPPRDNLQKLYWLLTRMGGYTGVLNHMGARFTGSAADFAPVMEELGMRGLSYLDDGSSNRSIAAQLARQNQVPFARAQGALDSNPARSEILAKLDGLLAAASENGSAIGTISALPVSISTLASWANGLDSSQYLLVPVSALVNTGDR